MTQQEEVAKTDFAFVFSLPPMLEKIFVLLLQHHRVTTEQITAQVPKCAEPKSAMFRLRKFLKKYEVELKSKRHMGYWIEPADKKKLLDAARVTLQGSA